MLTRDILVEVDRSTWPSRGSVPAQLLGPTTQRIHVHQALHMLGNLTMPNVVSPASPARFWAWFRYFIAVARSPGLRITTDFADLDPHQKGILSDDFGVAIATQWLYDRLGGFSDIVDGRRFMSQYASIIRRPKPSSAKVGPTKSPDFVVKDNTGKWHVVECKGTQSGRGFRNQFLKTAYSQKQVIQIKGALRGERLAIGLALSNELDQTETHLKIVDPKARPEIVIDETQSDDANLRNYGADSTRPTPNSRLN